MYYISQPKQMNVLELYKAQIYQVPKEQMWEYLILLTREFGTIGLHADDNPLFPRTVAQLDMGYSQLGTVHNLNGKLLIKLGDVSWSFELSDCQNNKVKSHIRGLKGADFDYLLKFAKEKSDEVKSTKLLEQFEVEITKGEVWYYTLEELYDFLDIKGIEFKDYEPIKLLSYNRNHSRDAHTNTAIMKALDGSHYSFHRKPGLIIINKYEIDS